MGAGAGVFGSNIAKPSENAKVFMAKYWGLTMEICEKTFQGSNWTLKCQMKFNTRIKTSPTTMAPMGDLQTTRFHTKAMFWDDCGSWPFLGKHPFHFHMQNLRAWPHITENSCICTLTQQSPLLLVGWKSLDGEVLFELKLNNPS